VPYKDKGSERAKASARQAKKKWALAHPKEYYQERGSRYRSSSYFNRRELLRKIRETTPCVDCGRLYPWYVMEFDHVPERGRKTAPLSRFTSGGIGRFQEELSLCDVVCSNCHATRTFRRAVAAGRWLP
jgi:hypothetical protein